MKKIVCLLCGMILLLQSVGFAAAVDPFILEHDGPAYSEHLVDGRADQFAPSGTPGYPDELAKGTRYTTFKGRFSQWTPDPDATDYQFEKGRYVVSIYSPQYTVEEKRNPTVIAEVLSNGGNSKFSMLIDQTKEPGWVELGVFEFVADGAGKECVKLINESTTGLVMVADAVKFEKTDRQITPSKTVTPEEVKPSTPPDTEEPTGPISPAEELVIEDDGAPMPSVQEIEEQVYSVRKEPVTEFPVVQTLRVRDYGALPDDGIDDTGALEQALLAAKTVNGPVEIQFEKGTYHFKPFQGGKPADTNAHCIQLDGMEDVILNGCGADIIVQNPFMGFISVTNSKRIIVKNFNSVDYDPLPYIQATITQVDPAGAITLKIDDEFSDFGAPYLYDGGEPSASLSTTLYDTETKKMKFSDETGGWVWLKGDTKTKVADRTYAFQLQTASNAKDIAPGDTIVLWNTRRPVGIVRCSASDTVTVQNITAHASVNTGFSSSNVSNLALLDCSLIPKEGRVTATNADSMTIFGGSRIGPWIENCVIENVTDDICQNEGFRFTVERQLSDYALKMNYAYKIKPGELQVGDTILFFNMKNAVPFFEAKITELDSENKIITFDKKLPSGQIYPATAEQNEDITLLFNKDFSGSNYIIKNNVFKNGLGCGIISYSPKSNGIIEGNIFDNVSEGSVFFTVHASPTYYVSFPGEINDAVVKNDAGDPTENQYANPAFVQNIIIRNNTFLNSQGTQKSYREKKGAVNFFFYGSGWNLDTRQVGFKDVYLTGNRFVNVPRILAVDIRNAKNFVVQDNLFYNQLSDPFIAYAENDSAVKGKAEGLIGIGDSMNITVENNRAVDQRSISVFVKEYDRVRGLIQENNVLADSFFDDTRDHWAKEDIDLLFAQGVIKGTSDTQYEPEENISRAEFTALLTRVLGLEGQAAEAPYPDVAADAWYASSIQAAKEAGLIDAGMLADGSFAPEAPISREDMACMLSAAYQIRFASLPQGTHSFVDSDEIADYAKEGVAAAVSLGIVKGYTESSFAPKLNATRAQAAVMVKRFLALSK